MHHQRRRKTTKVYWQRICLTILALLGIIGGDFVNSGKANAVSARQDCVDVQFIFGRGSGEDLDGPSFNAWRNAIVSRLGESDLTYDFYELGEQEQDGHRYTANPISGSLWGYLNLVDAFIYNGEGYFFGGSVKEGVEELKVYMNKMLSTCPLTQYVLGGYSQGAMTIMKEIEKYPADKIIYISTFGDPKLYLPEGKPDYSQFGAVPSACRGENLSPYRIYVPDCYAYEGSLGGKNPYQSEQLKGKIGLWCNKMDIMCSSGRNTDDHVGYESSGLYQEAGKYIYQALKSAFPGKFPTRIKKYNMHDLVLLFDATDSMKSMIDWYKKEALSLSKDVIDAGGRVSFYQYQDAYHHLWPVRYCDLGCTLEQLEVYISDIETKDCGTPPESLLQALQQVMTEQEWRDGVTKSIVVLTDDIYHVPDKGGVREQDVTNLSLSIDPVNVYVITREDKMDWYQTLTEATGGKVFNINDNLSEISDLIYYRPVAKLDRQEYYGMTGGQIIFDASESYSLNDDELTYEWDLDGTGKFVPGDAVMTQAFASEFDSYIQVRISDSKSSSTMSAHLQIVPSPTPVITEIANLKITTNDSQTQSEINFTTGAAHVLAMTDATPLGFVELKDGAGKLTVNLGSEEFNLHLVPYSETDFRGIAQDVLIPVRNNDSDQEDSDDNQTNQGDNKGDNQDYKTDPDDKTDNENKEPMPKPDEPEQELPNNPIISRPVQTIATIAQQPVDKPRDTISLKAPNTGTCSLAKYCQH